MSEPNNPPPPPEAQPTPPPPSGEGAPTGGGGTGGAAGSGSGGSTNTVMLVLSYLGILALIPLLVEKDDKEVQWHAKHGLVLLVMWVAIGVVFTILANIPVLGCLAIIVSLVIPLIALVLHVLCIVKAVNGERFLIPGVSQYADKF